MDISDTLAPNSEQLDAVDLLSGPKTFTITDVSKGNAEQPVNIHLADFPRPWRPGKSMRRVLVSAWGPDAATYVGRRVQLYCDPSVVFGGQAVGGTRIAALSHIDKPKQVPLLVSRGKSAIFTVNPLADEPPAKVKPGPTLDVLLENAQEARNNDELNEIARQAVASLSGADLEAVKTVVTARRAELKEPADPPMEGDWPAVAEPGGAR